MLLALSRRCNTTVTPPWERSLTKKDMDGSSQAKPGVGFTVMDLARAIASYGFSLRQCALGFWGALREALPEIREHRCWLRKIANVERVSDFV
jgi:hypothetical protein